MSEQVSREFSSKAYESLMHIRIKKILMICSNYDVFIMQEDGQIESRIKKEYSELNISNPPSFIWANSSAAAREIQASESGFDLIICMYNEQDKDIFPLAAELKEAGSGIPFVLLMHYSKEIRRKVTEQMHRESVIDYLFSWQGNADLILAIIKLLEDQMNADNDILDVGVQAIMLVEDSIRYYSTYLPELYKLVITQSSEFLRDTLNEAQQRNRKRTRPKILLSTCYNDAVATFNKYKNNLLGIITDVGMVINRGDDIKTEKLTAGVDIVNLVRSEFPLMPILMESSQEEYEQIARKLNICFVRKYSRTLFMQLSDFIKEEFGFGDFVFRDSAGREYGRASSLMELRSIVDDVPDDVLVSNTSKNMFSKWFFARGLFGLGRIFRSVHHDIASEARDFMKEQVRNYLNSIGRGIVAEFKDEAYYDYITFARIGDGSMGGKARGLGFLNKMVEKYNLPHAYEGMDISIPRSVVISTEYFDKFIEENNLEYILEAEMSDDEILSEFVAARLPEELVRHLKAYLATISRPIAVRSSSKLEDSNYQPFAGVYSTYMIPCVENKDQMLRLVGKAIKSVYASVYFNGSRTYVHSTGNLQSEEQMAVILQDICGSEHGGLFYPMMSGVGRSVNFYPIEGEKPEDGTVSVAFGLGKAVVDGGKILRLNPCYPNKILQLTRMDLAMKDTQSMMYALDLRPGAFKISRNESINFVEIPVVDAIMNCPYSNMVFSTYDFSSDRIVPGTMSDGPKLVTYDAIFRYGKFPVAKALKDVMDICKAEFNCDVEVEFAADMRPDGRLSFKLLQARPVGDYRNTSDRSIEDVTTEASSVIIRSDMALGAGFIRDIDYIVYVPEEKWDCLKSVDIAAEILKINNGFKSAGAGYLLIGPGRWGSSVHSLGIPVDWSDISEAKVIVECGIRGLQVEPSQGTHFFQNITSLGIGYMYVDTVLKKDGLDTGALDAMECVHEGMYARVLKPSVPMFTYIDRNRNRAITGTGE